jgi:uncharacterized integral membrane protein
LLQYQTKNRNIMTVLRKKVQFSFWIFIILAVLLVIFSVQNSEAIGVRVFLWNVEVSLAILLIGTFLTGLVTGALYAYRKFLPDSKEKEKDQKKKNLYDPQSTNYIEKDF